MTLLALLALICSPFILYLIYDCHKVDKLNKYLKLGHSTFFDIYDNLITFNGQKELNITKELIKKYNIQKNVPFIHNEIYKKIEDYSDCLEDFGYVNNKWFYTIILTKDNIIQVFKGYIQDESDGISYSTSNKEDKIIEISYETI